MTDFEFGFKVAVCYLTVLFFVTIFCDKEWRTSKRCASVGLPPILIVIGGVKLIITSHFNTNMQVTAKDNLLRLMEKEINEKSSNKFAQNIEK